MTWFFLFGILGSFLFAVSTGQAEMLTGAVSQGAGSAVELCISMAGMLCLWCGVLKVMEQSGMTAALRSLLRPVLKKLYPDFANDSEVMDGVSANMAANLMGVGNAATPFGISAARGMTRRYGGRAGDGLCTLVVCNTASIQLLPTTVAAIRSGAGCASPMDILPAVWLTSAGALAVGLLAARLLRRVWP